MTHDALSPPPLWIALERHKRAIKRNPISVGISQEDVDLVNELGKQAGSDREICELQETKDKNGRPLRGYFSVAHPGGLDSAGVKVWETIHPIPPSQAQIDLVLENIEAWQRWLAEQSQAVEAPKSRHRDRARWIAEAMITLHEHPEWSNAKIARKVGISPSQLTRCREYRFAASLARQPNLPSGHVTKDPDTRLRDVEAYDNSDMG